MRRFHKRGLAAFGVGVILIAGAGAGFAYWTQSGGGNGTGAVGTSGTITVTGTVGKGLFPGGSVDVTYTAANSGTSAVRLGTVSGTVTAATGGCDVSAFSLSTATQDADVAAGAMAQALPASGTLSMANTVSNQDNCKSSTLTLTLTTT